MKNYFTIIGLLLFSMLHAQTITIVASGSADSTLKINRAVNGYFGFPNNQTFTAGAGKVIQLNDKMTMPGNINIIYNSKNYAVFVEPGKSMHISIAVNGNDMGMKVKGLNAAGIELAAKLNHPYYQETGRDIYKKDTTMAGIRSIIQQKIKTETQPFDSLLVEKKIDRLFYNSIIRDIRCYYASVEASIIANQFFRTTLPASHPYHKASLAEDMADYWPEIYKNCPPDASYANSPDFYYYAKDYVMWYKAMFLGSKDGSYQKQPFDKDNQYELNYNGIAASFTGSIKEYLLAMYLYDELLQQEYQRQLVELYNRFTSAYPNSGYTKFLKPLEDHVKTYLAKANENFTPDEHLLASSSINGFDDVLANFKGKTVFVDMWATWCGPCKAEFEYAPGLEKYLASHHVQMLYISMDYDSADKQWQEMIKYYGLAGNHVRATDSLRKNLVDRFWGGQGYSIPRYLIIKNGVVVEQDALRPSYKQKLYDQISRYL